MFSITNRWVDRYPDASVGLLAMGQVENPVHHRSLELEKSELERELRSKYGEYDRQALRALPILQAYDSYYRSFKKTYHVQLQLESVVFKGKSIPAVAALVECMFMAELKDQMLTAGHDLDLVRLPVRLDAAEGDEVYIRINQQEQVLKRGDMYIADQMGVLSSVVYGPDFRTQITPETTQVLFTCYAPAGIAPELVQIHLESIRDYVFVVSPAAEVISMNVLTAASHT